MNSSFKRKSDFVIKKYPNADEKHLYKMLGILIKPKIKAAEKCEGVRDKPLCRCHKCGTLLWISNLINLHKIRCDCCKKDMPINKITYICI